MTLRRGLLLSAALFLLAGIGTLTLGLACSFEAFAVGGVPCALWLLGPFLALPLGLGLGLIGRAAGREPSERNEPTGCDTDERGTGEET